MSAEMEDTTAKASAERKMAIMNPAAKYDTVKAKDRTGQVSNMIPDHLVHYPEGIEYLERDPESGQPASTMYANGGTVRFLIKRGPFLLEKFWVRVTLTESGGANAVVPVATPLALSSWKIYGDNTSNLLCESSGECNHILARTCSTREAYIQKWENCGGLVGDGTLNRDVIYSHRSLAASATREQYFYFDGNFIELAGHMWLENINEDMVLELNLNVGTGANVVEGSGTCASSNWKLCMLGCKLPVRQQQDFRRKISERHTYKTLEKKTFTFTNQTTSGSTYDVDLNFLRDKRIAAIFVGFLLAGDDNNQEYVSTNIANKETYVDLLRGTTIEIVDSNERKLRGQTPMRLDILKSEVVIPHVPGYLFQNADDPMKNLIPIIFVKDWEVACRTGKEIGGHYLAGNDKIRFTFDSSYGGNTTDILKLHVFYWGQCSIQGGLWENKINSA
jgi:hypothetical protein